MLYNIILHCSLYRLNILPNRQKDILLLDAAEMPKNYSFFMSISNSLKLAP